MELVFYMWPGNTILLIYFRCDLKKSKKELFFKWTARGHQKLRKSSWKWRYWGRMVAKWRLWFHPISFSLYSRQGFGYLFILKSEKIDARKRCACRGSGSQGRCCHLHGTIPYGRHIVGITERIEWVKMRIVTSWLVVSGFSVSICGEKMFFEVSSVYKEFLFFQNVSQTFKRLINFQTIFTVSPCCHRYML